MLIFDVKVDPFSGEIESINAGGQGFVPVEIVFVNVGNESG